LQNAVEEMKNMYKFDYFIVNEDLEQAKEEVLLISKLTDLKPSKTLTQALIDIWTL
jgi:guanylate kinase